MSFIRAKEIPPGSGNWYDYEVMGIREGKKVRQKVLQYLGKSGTSHASRGGTRDMSSYPVTDTPAMPNPMADDTRITKMKTPARQIASALGMYYGGMSLDGLQQQFKQDYNLDMSESNYWNWVKRFTHEAIKQAKDFHPVVGDTWVADETYMKLGRKTVYFWDIIDSESRFLLASHVSTSRGAKEAEKLMRAASDRAGKSPKLVVTDKLGSYIGGIEEAYGADSKHVQGGPFHFLESGESTALIERFHNTLEQRTKVFRKYKDLADIRLLTDGWLINYNYFKQNEGAGNIPPAQAMSKIVPFKDWNDIVRDDSLPDIDYRVRLHKRPSVKVGNPVMDATLTPVEASEV
ncbi:MAG: Integrase catalytic protein [Dehalococcoidales bacterium]|nr:Integrase catalytic protein [Dehalococcoidales bacterium]